MMRVTQKNADPGTFVTWRKRGFRCRVTSRANAIRVCR